MPSINSACTLCPLYEGATTVCMAGSGPKNARIVIVGEAPGEQEDKTGFPFVGDSGKLLNQVLEAVGIPREDIFITNAVKCRPEGNATPKVKSISACRPYLREELLSVSPKVIVVMGNIALKAVTGESGITKARSRTNLNFEGIPVVATFHPSAYLHGRSQQILEDITFDLRRAAVYLRDESTLSKIEWEWGTMEVNPHDYSTKIWSFDIETNGKDISDPALQILLLGISDGRRIVVYGPDMIGEGIERLARAVFQQSGPAVFGHNSIGFDAEAIFAKYRRYLPVDDTLILAHQIDERVGTAEAHGKGKLESLAVSWLNVPPWKQQVTWEWDKLTDAQLLLAAQYNAEDVAYTHRLAELLLAKGTEMSIERGYDISKSAAIVFEHFVNRTGIAYDFDKAEELKSKLITDSMSSEYEFKSLVGKDINLQSPKQVGEALFKDLGLPPHHFTKSGQASTDELSLKSILLEVASSVPTKEEKAMRALLKYRENRKLVQFLESWSSLQVDGRLFPEYSVTSTVTYRTSSYNPNVQQWPHDPRVRSLLTAEEGNVLTESDYSQIELREIAEQSESQVMRQIFLEKIDPHRYMASLITNKPMELVTSDERYVAKPVNFGLGYGGDIYTLRKQALLDYDIVMEVEEAQRLHDLYHDTYQLGPWYKRIADELRANGSIRNPIGRVRHLPNIFSANPKMRLEALRQAINFPVQSFACDIALLAIAEATKIGLKVVAFIHDALYVESAEKDAAAVKEVLQDIMTVRVPSKLKTMYGVTLVVPLEVDIKQKTRTLVLT